MIDGLLKLITGLLNTVLSVLPHSPFAQFLDSWVAPDYLGVLNWFIPFALFRVILTGWLAAIGLFYLWSVVMRWIKLIGD